MVVFPRGFSYFFVRGTRFQVKPDISTFDGRLMCRRYVLLILTLSKNEFLKANELPAIVFSHLSFLGFASSAQFSLHHFLSYLFVFGFGESKRRTSCRRSVTMRSNSFDFGFGHWLRSNVVARSHCPQAEKIHYGNRLQNCFS